MLGISYGAISQLFVAADRSAGPGGDRAAVDDRQHRHDAVPGRDPQHRLRASAGARQRAARRRCPASADRRPAVGATADPGRAIETCKRNQVLHGEAPNVLGQVRANSHYVPRSPTRCAPITFVHKIHVPDVPGLPVDRRADRRRTAPTSPSTSPAPAASGSRSPTASTSTRSTRPRSTAGTTSSSCTLRAERRSSRATRSRRLAPTDLPDGAGDQRRSRCRPTRSSQIPTYAAALAAFQRLPPIRVLFDNGAGGPAPGDPYPGFEDSFSRFPIPGTQARSWYLGNGGTMDRGRAGRRRSADTFTWNPRALPATDFTGATTAAGGLWAAHARLPLGLRTRPAPPPPT